MVIELDENTTREKFLEAKEQLRKERIVRNRAEFAQFFGALPDIGDGLEYQRRMRNGEN